VVVAAGRVVVESAVAAASGVDVVVAVSGRAVGEGIAVLVVTGGTLVVVAGGRGEDVAEGVADGSTADVSVGVVVGEEVTAGEEVSVTDGVLVASGGGSRVGVSLGRGLATLGLLAGMGVAVGIVSGVSVDVLRSPVLGEEGGYGVGLRLVTG